MSEDQSEDLIVLRCQSCGDTFTVHGAAENAACPSCGGTDHQIAHEPLL